MGIQRIRSVSLLVPVTGNTITIPIQTTGGGLLSGQAHVDSFGAISRARKLRWADYGAGRLSTAAC